MDCLHDGELIDGNFVFCRYTIHGRPPIPGIAMICAKCGAETELMREIREDDIYFTRQARRWFRTWYPDYQKDPVARFTHEPIVIEGLIAEPWWL